MRQFITFTVYFGCESVRGSFYGDERGFSAEMRQWKAMAGFTSWNRDSTVVL